MALLLKGGGTSVVLGGGGVSRSLLHVARQRFGRVFAAEFQFDSGLTRWYRLRAMCNSVWASISCLVDTLIPAVLVY